MAEKNSYPQIPTTVWWGVRAILNRSPKATIDDTFLSVELGVQAAAAKQYVAELKRVGILDDNNKATETANKWRLADTYEEAVREITEYAYPQSLRDVSPPEAPDRDKATSWFERQGLGSGAARNKAATYLMISSHEPGDSPKSGNAGSAKKTQPTSKTTERVASKKTVSRPTNKEGAGSSTQFPLNINLQIHIGADASAEQIDSIFSAMKKYLSNDGSN